MLVSSEVHSVAIYEATGKLNPMHTDAELYDGLAPHHRPKILQREPNLHMIPGSLEHRVAYGNSDSDKEWVSH